MLTAQTLLARDGVEVANVACRHHRGRGDAEEHAAGHAIVLVRRGCFVRSVDGVESVLDSTMGYCMNPGEEQRYDHPHDGGDDCTLVRLNPVLAASMRHDEPHLPVRPFPIAPALDTEHRILLSALRRGIAADEIGERTVCLAASALALVDPSTVAAGRPRTAHARRSLVDGTREILTDKPETSLPELARSLAVSAHHLSRVFRSLTGVSISRHRMRLRTREALERLSGGECDLARLAADLGFADQSHLCRVLRSETGSSPSALRTALTGGG